MRKDQARLYGRVRASADKVKSLTRMLDAATAELHESLGVAASKDIPHNALADVSGYSEGRVWQIVNDWQPARRRKGKEANE